MWPLITHYHAGPWNYYGHLNIIVVLHWEWSVYRKLAWGFQNGTGEKKKHISSEKIPLEPAGGVRSNVLWLLFLFSSVNECRGDLFVWGREQRGSLISTPFYLCPTAPASQPSVLSHAGVPQEAALHEGQRSGKKRKPLVLSFTTKPTNTWHVHVFSLGLVIFKLKSHWALYSESKPSFAIYLQIKLLQNILYDDIKVI